jgi:SAM-dependent methyltransferase
MPTNKNWWEYDELPSGEPYDWVGQSHGDSAAARGDSPYDNLDFHLDLGCGTLPKARLGIDRFPGNGVGMLLDLDAMIPASFGTLDSDGEKVLQRTLEMFNQMALGGERFTTGLPFPTGSIESIISHHMMEHLSSRGFIALIDECHRVLKPGGILRAITPLFPSRSAVEDPDHKLWIMEGTFETFCGAPDGSHWHESFSRPYTESRFEMVDKDFTAPVSPEEAWGDNDVREIRVALRKYE